MKWIWIASLTMFIVVTVGRSMLTKSPEEQIGGASRGISDEGQLLERCREAYRAVHVAELLRGRVALFRSCLEAADGDKQLFCANVLGQRAGQSGSRRFEHPLPAVHPIRDRVREGRAAHELLLQPNHLRARKESSCVQRASMQRARSTPGNRGSRRGLRLRCRGRRARREQARVHSGSREAPCRVQRGEDLRRGRVTLRRLLLQHGRGLTARHLPWRSILLRAARCRN